MPNTKEYGYDRVTLAYGTESEVRQNIDKLEPYELAICHDNDKVLFKKENGEIKSFGVGADTEAIFLKQSDAENLYLSKTDASTEYTKKSDAENLYLKKSGGTATGTLFTNFQNDQIRGYRGASANLNDRLTSTEMGWSYTGTTDFQSITNGFPTTNNANGVLSFNTHSGAHGHQLGFSSNGNMYTRNNSSGSWSGWKTMWNSGNFDPNTKLNTSGGTLSGALTVNSRVLTTGTGNDYHLGGVEIRGNGSANTVYPTLGFHQPGSYASSLQLRSGGNFYFYNQGSGALSNIHSASVNCSALNVGSATNALSFDGNYVRIGGARWVMIGTGGENVGFMPTKSGTEGSSSSFVGNSAWWFKEIWGYALRGGYVTVSGNITAYSDEKLKENIEVIPNALDKIEKIRGVTYNRKDLEGKPRQVGVIAQEVEKVLPEVISKTDDGTLSVAYGNMAGLFIEAIKELKDQNKKLLERIEKLEEGRNVNS